MPVWWPYAIGGVVGLGLLILVAAMFRKPKRELVCQSCHRVLMAGWTECKFCGTPVGQVRGELEFVSGPLVGQTINLDREVTTIGSVAGNTVLLTDTGVSRKHVGIKKVGNGYELADLGSTNGVYVNGEKVARRRLATGDVIRIGATEIVFRG